VHSQIRTINYDTGAMREEFTLSRAEPKAAAAIRSPGSSRTTGISAVRPRGT
jgi:hypothetical protein